MIIQDRKVRIQFFRALLVGTFIMLVVMQVVNTPLKTDAAPAGIVTFELTGSLQGAQVIMASWTGKAMTWAALSMGLDFLFLALYGLTIALACVLLAEGMTSAVWISMGVWLAYAVLLAAVLDIIENIALIRLLLGADSPVLPILAKWMAIPKFLLVLLSLLYLPLAWVISRRQATIA